jgi:hypothetical protein
VTQNEFASTLAKTLHRPRLLPAPGAVVKFAFGEMSEAVLSSQRTLPSKALNAGFHFEFAKLADALADIYPAWYRESLREFVAHQWVPRAVEDVFPFFSDASNLEAITPPWLNFHLLGKSTQKLEAGTRIDYRLRLHGLPLRWQSRIEEWIPNQRFVDFQTRGPYSHWRHTHIFTPLKGGTLLTDRILYKVPLGKLGAWLAGRYVDGDVGKIFEYRKSKIDELFPAPSKIPRSRAGSG